MTNTNDSGPGSLRSAIEGATTPSDSIDIPPGTYRLTSAPLRIDSVDLALVGSGSAATRIEATGPFRVLCITGTSDVQISGLTISGGRGVASPGCSNGQGGGIHDAGTGFLSISGSVIESNSVTVPGGGGGGIFKAAGLLEVEDSIIRANSATATGANSGGGGIRSTSPDSPVFRDSTFSANSATVAGATSGGGAIYSQSAPVLENVTLSANRLVVSVPGASGGGGALFARFGGGDVDHVTFAGNSSDLPGGAIARGGGTPVPLENSAFGANSAPTGPACAPGAVDPQGGNVESTNSCGPASATELRSTDPNSARLRGTAARTELRPTSC